MLGRLHTSSSAGSLVGVAAIVLSLIAPFDRVSAQDFQGGLHFLLAVPQEAFRTNIDRNGYGLSGQIGFAPYAAPFMVGLEIGYMNYGSEERQEPFSTTIPDVTVDVNTNNNIVLGHALLRLQPNTGFFRPYAEGIVGLNYLFTTTEIRNRGNVGEEVASSTNFDDVAFSYGGGGGMMFRVHQAGQDDGSGIREVLVDLRVRYVIGGEAEYLREGSIRRENGRVSYDIQRSETTILTFQIGVAVRF
jgi:hypothetical protein